MHFMKLTLLISAAAAIVAGAPALAQQAPKPMSRATFINGLNTRFATIDANHDGKISRDEIVAAQARDVQQAQGVMAKKLQDAFKRLDTNHDGKLSLNEFMATEPNVHPSATPDQIIQQLDTNHDGKISADEFRAPDLARFQKADLNHDGVVTPEEAAAASKK
jgi:Ca2+-binding EF-hand superfamily protein